MRFTSFFLLAVLLVSGCDSCRQSLEMSGGFTFAKGAEGAAALPWQPWTPALLARAKAEKKPILVSFVAPLCERCDLLDRTTLSNERVAEVLGGKFLLARVSADADPGLALRLADGNPSLVALNENGDTVWRGNYLQPTPLNKALFEVLRGEAAVSLAADRPRYAPAHAEPRAEYAFNLGPYLVGEFDPQYRGYTSPKRLATWWMAYDLLLGGMEYTTKSAPQRFRMHLGGLFEGAHEPRDGGFLTGALNADWRVALPIKYAAEQAEMAEIIAALATYPRWHYYLERPITDYTDAADKAVDYLRRRLVADGRVFTGEMAALEYYRGDGGTAPVRDETARTDVAGRTAAALARGGLWLGRPAWIALAAEIAERALRDQLRDGRFFHIAAGAVAPGRLEDAAAMLDAATALYLATADDRWLAPAHRIAKALGSLRTDTGYFVDATETTGFVPEAPPVANAVAARALWHLGAIDNDVTLRQAAFDTVSAFVGNPGQFGNDEGLFGIVDWEVTSRFVRYELPRAWRERPAAASLVRSPRLGRNIKWTDETRGRVCDGNTCGAFSDDPAVLAAQAAAYFTTGSL